MIWAKVFLASFLVPVSLLFLDTFFDVALVQEYGNYNDTSLEAEYNWCRNKTKKPEILPTITCEEEIFSTMSFACTPLKLNMLSRFNYSMAFVLLPWLFYLFEFLLSSSFERLRKVMQTKF